MIIVSQEGSIREADLKNRYQRELERQLANIRLRKVSVRQQLNHYMKKQYGDGGMKNVETRLFYRTNDLRVALAGGSSYQETLPLFVDETDGEQNELWVGDIIEQFLLSDRKPNILDIGFGAGKALLELRRNYPHIPLFAYGSTANLAELEIRELADSSVHIIGSAQLDDDCNREQLGNIIDIAHFWEKLSLPKMDIVLASRVLHHIDDYPLWELIAQLNKIMNINAYAFISELYIEQDPYFSQLVGKRKQQFCTEVLGIDFGIFKDRAVRAFQKFREFNDSLLLSF